MVVAIKTMKDWTLEHIEEAHMEYVKSAQDFIVDSALIIRPFKHENVMTLVGVIIDGPTPYVVLPYMDNGSLLDFLKNRNNTTAIFSAADLLGFGRQVACGMAYLHEASGGTFIHRDLAARNCMVDMNAVIKIADFGLVRDADYYYRLTDHTRRLPLKWMAIESMEDNIFSSKTDVWSYGVLLWELLTLCETPYNNIYPEQLKQHLLSGRRLPKPPECPEVIYDLMLSCWEHSPDDRPSFLEILRNLEGYLSTVESEGQRNGIHDPMVDFANQFMENRSRSLTPRSRTPSLSSRRSRSPRPRSRSVSPRPRTRSRLPLRRRSFSCSPRPRSRSPPPKFKKRTRSGSRSFSPRRRRSFRGPHSYSRSRPRSHLRYPPRSYSRSPPRSYSHSPHRYCSYCSYSLSRPRSYSRSPPRSYSRSPPRSYSRSPLRSYSRSPPRYCSYCSYSLSRPRSYSWSPPHSYSHSPTCSYSRSPPRSYSRSPPRSYSRSPPRSYSWSPPRSYSWSPPCSYSRSPPRSYSRSPPRSYSRSPPRSYSRSPPRSYSHSPLRSYSHSPPRSYSRSRPRSYSRSPPRSYSRSPPHSYSWSPPYSCFYIKDWKQYLQRYQEWYAKYAERAGYPSKPPGYEMYCESLRYKSSSNLSSFRTETDNHENIHSADKKARQEKKHRRPKPSRSSSQETSHKKPRLESSVSATHTGVRSHAVQTDNNTVDTAVRSHAVKADNLMVEPPEWEESDDLFTLDEDEYKEAIRKNKTATAAATAAKKKPLPSSEKAEKVMDQSKFEPDYGEDMESDIVEKANVATDSAMANDSDDSPKSSDCSHGPDKKKKKKKKKPKKHNHKEHKEKKHKKSK